MVLQATVAAVRLQATVLQQVVWLGVLQEVWVLLLARAMHSDKRAFEERRCTHTHVFVILKM
jgi:hypothetical protein